MYAMVLRPVGLGGWLVNSMLIVCVGCEYVRRQKNNKNKENMAVDVVSHVMIEIVSPISLEQALQ